MAVLNHLEPQRVFRFFEELCAIPHGSGNTKAVSDWLVDFAKARGLRYVQDQLNNVVIFRDATPGYESAEPVILQGHMDMVCEKEPGCTKDMAVEGLDLVLEGDTVSARGTTLGGDDGIAVAMAMAILDDDSLSHPAIEAIFTVDEETGMYGAEGLDVEPAPADTNAQVDVTKDPFVVYCSGIDARSSNINITSRSDVNILAVVNPTTRQILLVNTPRDYYLPLAHNGQLDKLTHAGIYGTGESMQTLDNLYGTHTSFYMRVNFAGLTKIVDALGGVDVYSTKTFSMGGYNFTEGVNHLNGEAALCFSRERYAFADGDNQRGKNQMAVIQAIISKASSPAVLKNYQTLLSSLSDAFITSLSYDDIASLVQMQLQDMSGWHVTSYAVSGSGDTSYCYALGDAAWVMRPNMDTVNTAKELIRQVMSGETPQIP